MPPLSKLRSIWKTLVHSDRLDRELDDELAATIETLTSRYVANGMEPDVARRTAMRSLGGIERVKENVRDVRVGAGLDAFFVDYRYAWRGLRNAPRFATAVIITLALGVGATTAMFSVVYGVLFNPLRYPESDALVRIVHSVGGINQPYFNDAIYASYVENTQALQDLGVWSPGETATVTGRGDPEEVRALRASRGVLTTLGVQPELGRWFTAADDTPGSPDVVMLGHGLWQRTFGADPEVLDEVLTINARPHQIIGVMRAGFQFDGEPDVILPLRVDHGQLLPTFRLLGVARLKPNVTLTQANADATRVLHAWFEKFGVNQAAQARWAPALRSLKQDVVGDVGPTLSALMTTVSIVLVMACANVANLLLVRADGRQREFAIRVALGAGRARVARQLLAESVTLAVLAGALGLGLAYAGVRVLLATAPSSLPRISDISLDPVVLGFALTISLVSALVSAFMPILRFANSSLSDTAGNGRSGTTSRERQRSQQLLVSMQIALSLVLLVSAGLMIRSVQALRHVDPGFTEPYRIQTFSVSIPSSMVGEPERVTRTQQAILENIFEIPGVVSVAFATRLPMGNDRSSSALAIEGKPNDGRTPPNRQVKIISPRMFQTLGTALVAGRDFTWTDLYDKREVAIISENLARELWGSAEIALGRRIREHYVPESPWREIVGVAGNVLDDGADQPAPETIYWPAQPKEEFLDMSGYQARRVSVAVRTDRAGTEALLKQLQEAVWSVSADLPLARVRTLDHVYRESMGRTSFTLMLLTIAGVLALLLSISGLYGVIAYAVSQRRREIGIRLAVGAQPHQIRWLLMRRGLLVAGVGVAIGLGVAAAFTRLLQSLLFGTGPFDSITFGTMPILLSAAVGLASYMATRRAATVDPVETLRAGDR